MLPPVGWPAVAIAFINLVQRVVFDKHAWWRMVVGLMLLAATAVVGLLVLGVHAPPLSHPVQPAVTATSLASSAASRARPSPSPKPVATPWLPSSRPVPRPASSAVAAVAQARHGAGRPGGYRARPPRQRSPSTEPTLSCPLRLRGHHRSGWRVRPSPVGAVKLVVPPPPPTPPAKATSGVGITDTHSWARRDRIDTTGRPTRTPPTQTRILMWVQGHSYVFEASQLSGRRDSNPRPSVPQTDTLNQAALRPVMSRLRSAT